MICAISTLLGAKGRAGDGQRDLLSNKPYLQSGRSTFEAHFMAASCNSPCAGRPLPVGFQLVETLIPQAPRAPRSA